MGIFRRFRAENVPRSGDFLTAAQPRKLLRITPQIKAEAIVRGLPVEGDLLQFADKSRTVLVQIGCAGDAPGKFHVVGAFENRPGLHPRGGVGRASKSRRQIKAVSAAAVSFRRPGSARPSANIPSNAPQSSIHTGGGFSRYAPITPAPKKAAKQNSGRFFISIILNHVSAASLGQLCAGKAA